MAEGMAGTAPPDTPEAEPILCCPKCGTEFPVSEGIPEDVATGDDPVGPPAEEEVEGDYDGFRFR